MPEKKSLVAFVNTEDRKAGVKSSVGALDINSFENKEVLIKPNFNTADAAPGSTHNDTLSALIEEIWSRGAKSISLGERSYPPTQEVMEQKRVLPLLKKLDVRVINFDHLKSNDWVEFKPRDSHWKNGFRIARPILEAERLVYTCCLKTHGFGGVFTLSLKLSVGVVPTRRNGFDYMSELHSSSHTRKMIAEINQPFSPDLIVLDGIDAFVDGGPAYGDRVSLFGVCGTAYLADLFYGVRPVIDHGHHLMFVVIAHYILDEVLEEGLLLHVLIVLHGKLARDFYDLRSYYIKLGL